MRTADELAGNLRHRRLAAGLSLSELAARAEVSRSYLWKAEVGRSGLTVSALIAIAQALGVSACDLLRGEAATSATAEPGAITQLLSQAELRASADEIEMLASIRWPQGPPTTAARWSFVLQALRLSAALDPAPHPPNARTSLHAEGRSLDDHLFDGRAPTRDELLDAVVDVPRRLWHVDELGIPDADIPPVLQGPDGVAQLSRRLLFDYGERARAHELTPVALLVAVWAWRDGARAVGVSRFREFARAYAQDRKGVADRLRAVIEMAAGGQHLAAYERLHNAGQGVVGIGPATSTLLMYAAGYGGGSPLERGLPPLRLSLASARGLELVGKGHWPKYQLWPRATYERYLETIVEVRSEVTDARIKVEGGGRSPSEDVVEEALRRIGGGEQRLSSKVAAPDPGSLDYWGTDPGER